MNWLKRHWKCILLAVLVGLLCLIVCSLVFMTVGQDNIYGEKSACTYECRRPYIQNAVTEYIANNNEERPPHQGTYNIATEDGIALTLDVIDICSLVGEDALLRRVPDGCYGVKSESGTNFYSGECDNPTAGEYVWLMDESGNVYSTCIGNLCYANNMDGYQGVWLGSREPSLGDWWKENWSDVIIVVSFIVPFAITLFLCVYFKRRPQPPDEPADDL